MVGVTCISPKKGGQKKEGFEAKLDVVTKSCLRVVLVAVEVQGFCFRGLVFWVD